MNNKTITESLPANIHDSILTFIDGLTVKELKDLIKNWPEANINGEPCKVLVCGTDSCTNYIYEVATFYNQMNDTTMSTDIILFPTENHGKK